MQSSDEVYITPTSKVLGREKYLRDGLMINLRIMGAMLVRTNSRIPEFEDIYRRILYGTNCEYAPDTKARAKRIIMKHIAELQVQYQIFKQVEHNIPNWEPQVHLWCGKDGPLWRGQWQGWRPRLKRDPCPYVRHMTFNHRTYESMAQEISEMPLKT